MEINNNQATEISTGFNLKDFVIRYAKYLPLIILGLLISYYAAKIKLRYTTSMYNASGTMIIKAEKQNVGDKNVEDLFTSKAGNDLKTEIELMMSRKLMRRVVKSLNLQYSYSSKGKVKTSLLYESVPIQLELVNNIDSSVGLSFGIKILNTNQFEIDKMPGAVNFGQEFKIQNKVVKISKTNFFTAPTYIGQKLLLRWSPVEDVSNGYISSLKIGNLGDFTRILKISMVGENAKLCADVVNQIMEEYIKDNQESNTAVSQYTKAFIDERVKNLESDLKNIEANAKTFRENTKSINLDAQSTLYLSDLNLAQKEFTKQGVLLITAKDILTNFQKDVNVKDFAPPGIIDDVNLQNLFLQYNEAQFLRQRIIAEVGTTEDKTYIEKTNDAKRLRLAVIGGLTKMISTAEMNKYNVEKTIIENIQKLKDIPGLQNELLNYGRNQKIVEELYLFLKKKGEEAGITKASTKSNSEIVDYALVNNYPISPIPSKTYSLALFLGLLIPAAIAYIIELFNDKIRFRDDIEKQTKTPIIAEVGHNEESKTLIVTSKSRKVIAEQFRMIRTNLQYLVGAKEKYTVLVTSSFSGEGKSFISTNVGAALSLTGKRTVILEFDLRKPKVIEGLGMTKSVGITNFVVGKSELKDIIRPIPDYENLWVIGCGAIPPNPAELLLEDKIAELFTYLKANFDVIVIDSAPVGLVTDSMTLSKYADATLYIVRHKYTMKKQIRLIDELFTTGKLPKLSIVINDVVGSTGGYYGYGGYGYGYGRTYGYGYGYFDVSKRNRVKEIWQKIKGFLLFWK
jgi:tyrosine-protein kinase Etk/Wzc